MEGESGKTHRIEIVLMLVVGWWNDGIREASPFIKVVTMICYPDVDLPSRIEVRPFVSYPWWFCMI